MRRWFIQCVMVWFFVGNALGIEYYVDNMNGSDAYDGRSASRPWKSLDKIRTTLFTPGDIIHLRRGQVWRETMVMKSSGAPGSPVIVRAYGDGPDPVISGAVAPSPDQWTDAGSGIFRMDCDWIPQQVFEDDRRLAMVAWTTNIETTRQFMPAGSWTLDKNHRLLYVKTTTGAGPETHLLEISKLDTGIYNGTGLGNRYNRFENLHVEKANQNGLYSGKGSNAIIKNCTFRLNAKNGILIASSDTVIEECVAYDNRTGIASFSFDLLFNLQIINSCVFENHFWVDGDGIRLEAMRGAVIENCHIYNHDNGVHADNIQVAGGSADVTIRHCLIEDGRGIAITNQAGPVFIAHNLFQTGRNGTFVGVTVAKDGAGGRVEIAHNSFNHFLNGIIIGHAHTEGMIVENNIFNVAPNTAVLKLSSAASTPVYLDRNVYHSNGDVIIWDDKRYTLSTFGLYQSETGQDSNSIYLGTTIEYTNIPVNTVVVPTEAKADLKAAPKDKPATGELSTDSGETRLKTTNFNWHPEPEPNSASVSGEPTLDDRYWLVPEEPLFSAERESHSNLPQILLDQYK